MVVMRNQFFEQDKSAYMRQNEQICTALNTPVIVSYCSSVTGLIRLKRQRQKQTRCYT